MLSAACTQNTSDDGAAASGANGGALAGPGTSGSRGGASGAASSDGANGGALAITAGAGAGGAGGSAPGSEAVGGSGSGNAGAAGTAASELPFKGVANSPCAARSALNVSWYYNWTQAESEPCSDGKGGAFVPMIWGHAAGEQTATSIRAAISGFVSKGYSHVLGFNEPDNISQSNLPVATAISLLTGFANSAIMVGTPATQANSAGQAWFKDYMGQVAANAGLREDFIALHWYGWDAGSCDASASQLESYIKYAEGFPGNRPIWLTEWSCLNLSAPSAASVLAFYKGALAVFAKHPRVQRYAWFPWTANCELNNTDKAATLTPLGLAYAAAPATKSAP